MGTSFSIGEIVRSFGSKNQNRREGVVRFHTCHRATGSGGGTCDRKNCTHTPKDRIWVKWPDGSLCSYQTHELETDIEGEEEVLKNMEDLLENGEKEDVENATTVVKTILQARRNRASKPKVTTNMATDSNSLMGMIKADATKAGYRVAAKQINTGLRSAIVEMLKSKGASNEHIAGVAAFLETEWGAAILGTIAGHGLGYIPGLKDDPRVVRLAEEFRISSMTTVGNEIFEAALGQLLPVLTTALNALPAEAASGQTEGHKSTSEEVEIEIETDLSDLEDHMEKEEKKVARHGQG
jgi:hypothetical protein